MSQQVVSGAVLACTFGTATGTLSASAQNVSCTAPAAVVNDVTPANIASFGMCISMTNPEVASATAAALGTLTPMPCVPVLQPWTPGVAQVTINGAPALDDTSRCICAWAGVISVSSPGQFTTTVG